MGKVELSCHLPSFVLSCKSRARGPLIFVHLEHLLGCAGGVILEDALQIRRFDNFSFTKSKREWLLSYIGEVSWDPMQP